MNPYLVKTPWLVKRMFPKRVWSIPNNQNTVYLTFDDGPIPQVTPWILEQLKKHQAKATFFCVGENIIKHPDIVDSLISEKHTIGNHTFNHLNGWKVSTSKYINNVLKNEGIINSKLSPKDSRQKSELLFRPPFGKLTSNQSKILQKKGFKIIMWDILSGDFDMNSSAEKCLENILKNIESGSIIVFHDSLKAEDKLKFVLPKVLDYLSNEGFNCKSIIP